VDRASGRCVLQSGRWGTHHVAAHDAADWKGGIRSANAINGRQGRGSGAETERRASARTDVHEERLRVGGQQQLEGSLDGLGRGTTVREASAPEPGTLRAAA
jgi:hypothetical protein